MEKESDTENRGSEYWRLVEEELQANRCGRGGGRAKATLCTVKRTRWGRAIPVPEQIKK